MEQMSLSQVCKKYHFTRRVIQGYEKKGLIKHAGKNKYGYLMYDEEQVRKIAYIRYLQLNGSTLEEISACVGIGAGTFISATVLQRSNYNHKAEIERISKLIRTNETILRICLKDKDLEEKENEIFEIIMEEVINEKTI